MQIMTYHCIVIKGMQYMTQKEHKGELTQEVITWIRKKENQDLFFELMKAWNINVRSMYRWLRENRRPELSHPKTINIILKHNPGKIKIVQP